MGKVRFREGYEDHEYDVQWSNGKDACVIYKADRRMHYICYKNEKEIVCVKFNFEKQTARVSDEPMNILHPMSLN